MQLASWFLDDNNNYKQFLISWKINAKHKKPYFKWKYHLLLWCFFHWVSNDILKCKYDFFLLHFHHQICIWHFKGHILKSSILIFSINREHFLWTLANSTAAIYSHFQNDLWYQNTMSLENESNNPIFWYLSLEY